MRILLIDDDKDDQILFIEAVQQITDDVVCETADNGIAGIDRLSHVNDLPEVIFLDINMPLMDGRETLKVIRQDVRLDTIAVVIYSTSNSETDMHWARESNARYLVKPSDFPSLLKSLALTLNDILITQDKNQQIIRHAC